MNIRIINENDYDSISKIIKKTLKNTNINYSKEQINNWIRIYSSKDIKLLSDKWTFIVAEELNNIIGVGAYYKNEVHTLFVNSNYQNRGVGKNILKQLEEEIKKKYYKVLILGASINASKFYEKLGYRITHTLYNEFQMKVFEMEKDLGQKNNCV